MKTLGLFLYRNDAATQHLRHTVCEEHQSAGVVSIPRAEINNMSQLETPLPQRHPGIYYYQFLLADIRYIQHPANTDEASFFQTWPNNAGMKRVAFVFSFKNTYFAKRKAISYRRDVEWIHPVTLFCSSFSAEFKSIRNDSSSFFALILFFRNKNRFSSYQRDEKNGFIGLFSPFSFFFFLGRGRREIWS